MFISLLGLSLVIASGCVFNNYFDKDIDALMERTKHRQLVRGLILPSTALVYASCLGVLGFSILAFFTNWLTVAATFTGFFVYVVIYTLWLKRTSTHSTIVGSIAGAMPIVAGYVAVTSHIDVTMFILFLIMALWQMPHFFAISLYRLEDYTRAKIPVLPVRKTVYATKIQIVVYLVLFIVATLTLSFFGNTGHMYFYVMLLMGVWWFAISLKGFSTTAHTEKKWARSVFIFSIVVLVTFCVLLTTRL